MSEAARNALPFGGAKRLTLQERLALLEQRKAQIAPPTGSAPKEPGADQADSPRPANREVQEPPRDTRQIRATESTASDQTKKNNFTPARRARGETSSSRLEDPAELEDTSRFSPTPAASSRQVVRDVESRDSRPAPVVSGRLGHSAASSRGAKDHARRTANSNVLMSRRSPVLHVDVVGPETVLIGKPSSYVVWLENAGEVAAQDVVVTVNVPSWTELTDIQTQVGSTPPLQNYRGESQAEHYVPLTWSLTQLKAGGRQKLALELVPRASTPFDLGVQCAFSPVSTQAIVEVQEPKLEIAIAGPVEVLYGEKKVFKLSLSNPGTGDAEDIKIKVRVGEGAEQSANDVIPFLAAGDTKIIEMVVEAFQTGTLVLEAQAAGEGGLNSMAMHEVLVRRAELSVDLQGPSHTFARTAVTYAIHVGNPGNATAQQVTATVDLPHGTEFISATDGGRFDPQKGAVTWDLSALRAGTEHVLELRCQANEPGSQQVAVEASSEGDLRVSTSLATRVQALADLKVEVRDPVGGVPVGEEIVYEIHVSNRGTKAAEGIQVFVDLSEELIPVAIEGSRGEIFAEQGQVDFAAISTLPAGDEVVLKLRAKARESGNHLLRTVLECESPGLKLTEDESTFFYDPDALAE